ncbi:uncharacterized protein LOC135078196 [Ostrinia nubilalis]|uniref:uncharacterized protein LOC135078196 n=1 Tax=Ostrinia nubilalis TaxID=29057 RepID=UPI0030823E61
MRWIALIVFCAALLATWAEPDPKKYKSEVKDKDKATNASLTDEERKFLREVEAKFGVKNDVPDITKVDHKTNVNANSNETVKAPFPAVIAIEIVNDTDTNTKGKRTIDANLGYGYRTNHGYTYTYFGKPQDKGKFMIYPYSQEDIPPAQGASYNHGSSGTYTTASTQVEIQPSRAYELVDVKEEQNSYHYNKPTPSPNTNYQNIKGLVSPPPPYSSSESHQETPQTHQNPTLYTTYNGQDFSALSGQFPRVMSNYLVDSSQLLKNPQYQSAGLNQDYVKTHSSQLGQRVVPVLVLRVPSSYLKQPTAELYSNLPNNYPVSHYLQNVNLQEVVNNYFKKIGYSFAPQVMTYQNSLLSDPGSTPAVASHEPNNYANPHVNPAYTQADYSGVQYSAVQPVMAKYPTTYTSKEQYYVPMTQSLYQQPQQQYEYMYQYVPQQEQSQLYYVPQYQSQSAEVSHEAQGGHAAVEQSSRGHAEYGVPQQSTVYQTSEPTVEYGAPEAQGSPQHGTQEVSYESSQLAAQEYAAQKEQAVEYTPQQTVSAEYGPTKLNLPTYTSSEGRANYGSHQISPKETLAIYSQQLSQAAANYGQEASGSPNYYYQKQAGDESDSNTLVISENYPSKDHTLATVLPLSYKRDKKPNTATVQTVSYVTPMPYSHKYQSPYKIMVPQTVLRNPSAEKVSYVNSHSIPNSQIANQEYNPEAEYTAPAQYVPPVSKQKPPAYPRNYHSHPKRNAKPEKSENHSTQTKKRGEKNDHKKSS